MFAGGMLLAFTLVSFAVWLHWNERQGWPGEDYHDDDDAKYLKTRFRSRRRIHWIMGGCGFLIAVAVMAGPGRYALWVGLWSIVMLALMTVVPLALLDALRTHRYHDRQLPKIRQRFLNDDETPHP